MGDNFVIIFIFMFSNLSVAGRIVDELVERPEPNWIDVSLFTIIWVLFSPVVLVSFTPKADRFCINKLDKNTDITIAGNSFLTLESSIDWYY